MISYWVPPDAGTLTLPQSVLYYLQSRTSEAAVKAAMDSLQLGQKGKIFIPATIMHIIGTLSQGSSHHAQSYFG